MTIENPQKMTIRGLIFKFQREAIVLVVYPDGEYKTGPLIGQPKYSQGGGMQTNYGVSPLRPVQLGDPPITLMKEAVRWSLLGVAEREVIINRELKVVIEDSQFDAVLSCFYQKGNVPLPDGSIFLKEVCGYFNANEPKRAIAAFLRYNSGANNVPSVGHTLRRGLEGFMAYGDYGSQVTFPYFEGDPHIKANRQDRSTGELIPLIRELDPDRTF